MLGRSTWRVGAAALATLALLGAAGCGDDDDDDDAGATTTTVDAPPDGEGEGEGEAITVTAVDFGFEGLPEELPGGAVAIEFDNQGEVDHEIVFVGIGDDDSNAETFFDDFAPVVTEGGAFPEYVEGLVGANEAPPGESATFTYTIDPGTYMVFCTLTGTPEDPESEDAPPHYEEGMQQLVTVTEGEGDPELPEADGTITAEDYSFEVDLSAGDTVINFTNDGPNDHFAGFDRYPDGTTVDEAEAAFETLVNLEEGEAPPPDTPEGEEVGFSGIASAGQGMQFSLPEGLEAGTYVFYCFIQDRAGGPPHAVGAQMYQAVEIT